MSDINFSLIDLKALSKPATKLIEAVGSATGIIYEPTRIRRKAKAEADKALILAKAETEVSEINLRASERLINQELRRQKNIENIVNKSLKELPESVSEKPADSDWISQFFDYCKDISNEEIQSLWARILAGEVSNPGIVSYRTLNFIKQLTKKEAELITKFCSYLWLTGEGKLHLTCKKVRDYLGEQGLTYRTIYELQSIGLIEMGISPGFDIDPNTIHQYTYFGKWYTLSTKTQKRIEVILTTKVCKELEPFSGAKPDYKYVEILIENWNKIGIDVKALT